ncbi:MAG: hypothetical protein ACOZDY_02675 [Pseudomonadota bacterium]
MPTVLTHTLGFAPAALVAAPHRPLATVAVLAWAARRLRARRVA